MYYRYNLPNTSVTAPTSLIQAFIQHYNYRGINIMTDKEKLQAFKENLFDIRRCIDEGVPCPYGICNECIASNNYRDFLSLIRTDLTDAELREKEYNNYEQRRKETE